jgi:hypothetical protein
MAETFKGITVMGTYYSPEEVKHMVEDWRSRGMDVIQDEAGTLVMTCHPNIPPAGED